MTSLMIPFRRACVGLAALAGLLGLPMIAAAQASNPTRCEALKLKKESAYYDCLSRCDRRAARGRVEASECEARCGNAFDAAIFRVEHSPPCLPEPPPESEPPPEAPPDDEPKPEPVVQPDPEQCEAQLLQIEARELLCRVRCTSRASRNTEFDKASCDAGCEERCHAATDATLAKPICGSGRMPSGQMRQSPAQ
jgi:hypothetical protein